MYQGEVSGKFRNAARNRCNRYNELRVASWPRRFRRELVTPIEPARDRRPGILIFLARGEETVRRGRFMRKVADDSAERERERVSRSILEKSRAWKEAQDDVEGVW